MNQDTLKLKLRNWLIGTCHADDGSWLVRAVVLLERIGIPAQYQELRSFLIREDSRDDDIVEQIIGEAEAACEGHGGGTSHFMLKSFVDGERSARSTRPFIITLEQQEGFDIAETSAQGMLATVMRQNQELHRSVLQMSSAVSMGLPRIMESQAHLIEAMQRRDIDNFKLLRANVEDHERRQAEAAAIAQKSKDWSELKQVLLPAVLEHLGPVIAKFMERQMQSTPEEARMQVEREPSPDPQPPQLEPSHAPAHVQPHEPMHAPTYPPPPHAPFELPAYAPYVVNVPESKRGGRRG